MFPAVINHLIDCKRERERERERVQLNAIFPSPINGLRATFPSAGQKGNVLFDGPKIDCYDMVVKAWGFANVGATARFLNEFCFHVLSTL